MKDNRWTYIKNSIRTARSVIQSDIEFAFGVVSTYCEEMPRYICGSHFLHANVSSARDPPFYVRTTSETTGLLGMEMLDAWNC